MHTKSFTLAVSPCEATIDLWRVAREILGDAAHPFGFLKAAAASAPTESSNAANADRLGCGRSLAMSLSNALGTGIC